MVPQRLQEIAEQVHNNGTEVNVSVRELLSWFHAKRRGVYVVYAVRSALEEVSLTTLPDFEYLYIDASVAIAAQTQTSEEGEVVAEQSKDIPAEKATEAVEPVRHDFVSGGIEDPTFRIGQLEAANSVPMSVTPDSTLAQATTIMMLHDFSQLPVMQNERVVKGIISWESIGKKRILGKPCENVRDCMDSVVPEAKATASLFSTIDLIIKYGYVLVRQLDGKVSGIVTTNDLSSQFRQLAEPFLLVGEVENYIRRLIAGKFTIERIAAVKEPNDERPIRTVNDLTFGEYMRLLENPDNWAIVNLPLDRAVFINHLNRVRELRNDVMHFDPDPFADEDLTMLRSFVNFMRSLDLDKA